jgi:hypothetical protein
MSTLRHRLHSAGSATYQTLFGGSPAIVRQFAALGTLRALWHPLYGVTLNGSDVAAWRDLVAGYVLVQATPGAQPAYNATGWGAMPTIDYAGAEYLACAHADWNTLFGGDDANCVISLAHSCSGGNTCFAGFFGATATVRIMMFQSTSQGQRAYYRATASLAYGAPSTAFRHEAAQSVGIAAKVFVNGAQAGAGDVNAGSFTLSRFVTGCSYEDASGPIYFTTGKQGIVALYSTVSDHAALSALMTALGYAPD